MAVSCSNQVSCVDCFFGNFLYKIRLSNCSSCSCKQNVIWLQKVGVYFTFLYIAVRNCFPQYRIVLNVTNTNHFDSTTILSRSIISVLNRLGYIAPTLPYPAFRNLKRYLIVDATLDSVQLLIMRTLQTGQFIGNVGTEVKYPILFTNRRKRDKEVHQFGSTETFP